MASYLVLLLAIFLRNINVESSSSTDVHLWLPYPCPYHRAWRRISTKSTVMKVGDWVQLYSPLFTNFLGFFCFEMFCSLVQNIGFFKKSILGPSLSQASCQSQGYKWLKIESLHVNHIKVFWRPVVGGRVCNLSLFAWDFPDFSSESPASRNAPLPRPQANQESGSPDFHG